MGYRDGGALVSRLWVWEDNRTKTYDRREGVGARIMRPFEQGRKEG